MNTAGKLLKYLVDENISKTNKFLEEHPDFVNVKYALQMGVTDPGIIQKARLEQLVIVTMDTRLAMKALIAGVKVWYFDSKEIGHKLEAYHFS